MYKEYVMVGWFYWLCWSTKQRLYRGSKKLGSYVKVFPEHNQKR